MSERNEAYTPLRDRESQPTSGHLLDDTRGVQWTLEAFLAVLLLLTALTVVAGVVPGGTGQAEAEQAQAQLQQSGGDVLTLAADEGALEATVLYWDTEAESFINPDVTTGDRGHYTTFERAPGHPLAPLLAETLDEQALAYNIHADYRTATGWERIPIVYQGPPGGDSVRVSRSVLLASSDEPALTSGAGCETLANLSGCSTDSFFAPETADSAQRYTIVQVTLELWRV